MKKKNWLMIFLLFIFVLPVFAIASGPSSNSNPCLHPSYSEILYVHPSARGRNDGSSWSDAFTDLQAALRAAAAHPGGEQIWVAQGSYIPNGGPYVLPENVQILGGFRGNERNAAQRDPRHYRSILRGTDLDPTRLLIAQNVTGVMLDGFVLRNGHAVGNLSADALDATNEVRGGALLAVNADITLCRASFEDNQALKFGGAIYQIGGSLRVFASYFSRNHVLRGQYEVHDTDAEADTDGGAIAVHATRLFYVRDSEFKDNVAGDDGGAIESRNNANVQIIATRFLRNKGIARATAVVFGPNVSVFDLLITSMGGAVTIWNTYSGFNNGDQSRRITIKDSEFIENKAAIASAAYIESPPGSQTIIENSKFIQNGGNGLPDPAAPTNEQGVGYGRGAGALMIVGLRWGDREEDANGTYVRSLHQLSINNSLFDSNEGAYGGGVQLLNLNSKISHTRFINNIGRQRGGGIWSHNTVALFDQLAGLRVDFGTTQVEDSVFVNNQALGKSEHLTNENFPGITNSNEATFGGGGIANDASNNLIVIDSVFSGNCAFNSDGGAIHNGTNYASIYANAVPSAPVSYGANLTVKHSSFTGNCTMGSGSGGAIANGGSHVNGGLFDAARTDVRYKAAHSRSVIMNAVFEGNTAATDGGAFANFSGGELTMSGSGLRENRSLNGGALASVGAIGNSTTLQVGQSVIRLNTATAGRGGGIFARQTTGNILRSVVSGNTPEDVDWE